MMHKIKDIPLAVVLQSRKRVWETRTSSRDGVMRFRETGAPAPGQGINDPLIDAIDVRKRFMSIKTVAKALDFLNEYGAFTGYDDAIGWTLDELYDWQLLFAELATHPPTSWDDPIKRFAVKHENAPYVLEPFLTGTNLKLLFPWRFPEAKSLSRKPLLIVPTPTVATAILASLQFDFLRGARFRLCARRGCHEFYEITSRHTRKYCSRSCAHLVSVRRTRAKQKKKKGNRDRKT